MDNGHYKCHSRLYMCKSDPNGILILTIITSYSPYHTVLSNDNYGDKLILMSASMHDCVHKELLCSSVTIIILFEDQNLIMTSL